jgi:hypothetical protein
MDRQPRLGAEDREVAIGQDAAQDENACCRPARPPASAAGAPQAGGGAPGCRAR